MPSDPFSAALRLAAIVESSDDAIIGKDVNGVITSWNAGAERMFGYTAEEVIGKSITIIIPADRLSEEAYVLSRIRSGQKVDHFETLRQRKDGTLVSISLTSSPILDADGRVIGASKIARDISDRRRAETALADTEARRLDLQQRLVALLAASGTLFSSPRLADVVPAVLALGKTLIRADASAFWRFDHASSRWLVAGSTGLSDEFSRRIMESFEGQPASTPALSESIVAESVRDFEVLREQSAIYLAEGIESMLAVPLSIGRPGNAALAFYHHERHMFTDVEIDTARSLSDLAAAAITTAEVYEEQRRQREAAERANRQAAFLAEAGTAFAGSLDYAATLRTVAHLAVPRIADWCAVDIVDERGEIQRLAVAHVDPTRIEAARSFHERYLHDATRVGTVAHAIRTGLPVLVSEVRDETLAALATDDDHLRALRDLRICSYVVVPLAAHGRAFGAVAFVMAESGRHYTDADLRFAQDVAYRAALAVENARAYQQASSANRAKDEFLATLSHELRTPLNAVLGWVRMVRAGTLDPEKLSRALEIIERNAVAQLHLVEDLLDLSRIITGKFQLSVAPVNLAEVVEVTRDSIQPAATAKAIDVKIHIAADSRPVVGDRTRLQQAVWNLMSNAIKFTPHLGRVTVTLKRRGDLQMDLEVSDTGEGIEADVLPFVFDRFRQGESGTTRTHSGLGLGLAIVRHIVELHGGQVAAASEGKGRGSTFRLSLPAHVEGRAVAGTGRMARTRARRQTTVLAGLRVLVVDDDRDARELVTDVLRSRGITVTSAASADEGIVALDRDVPDVIVSDIAMPERDGYELIRQIRQRPPDRGGLVPAVALTAYARPEDSERSLSSGFQLHLAKPVEVDYLVSAVASLAGR
jgi:PAS domain S-box-containing protein